MLRTKEQTFWKQYLDCKRVQCSHGCRQSFHLSLSDIPGSNFCVIDGMKVFNHNAVNVFRDIDALLLRT